MGRGYSFVARARASLPARALARAMASASLSALAVRLLRPTHGCHPRLQPFHLAAVR